MGLLKKYNVVLPLFIAVNNILLIVILILNAQSDISTCNAPPPSQRPPPNSSQARSRWIQKREAVGFRESGWTGVGSLLSSSSGEDGSDLENLWVDGKNIQSVERGRREKGGVFTDFIEGLVGEHIKK